MRDVKHFTPLSFAAYKNSEECLIQLFNHAIENNLGIEGSEKPQDEKKQFLKTWVDAPTDEGFTCIHFATYHGNYHLLKFLTQTAQADIHVKNKFGSSVMHVAA